MNPFETIRSHSGANALPVHRKIPIGMGIALVLWLAIVGGGTIQLARYSNTPGSGGTAPANWPMASQIPFNTHQPNLIMFVHPRCPCTRSSLGELEVLMAQVPGRFSVRVVFVKPLDTETNWEKSDLWGTAKSIRDVAVCTDNAGVEARRFHAETSGQTLLYDQNGVLQFQGGITLSRGHSGDNPGRTALTEILRGAPAEQNRTPVFGCSLFGTECQRENTVCKP